MRLPPLHLRPSLAGLDAAGRAATILCPARRPGPAGELAALLPLHDPNALLLDALAAAPPGPAPIAAVFGADPFQRPADLAERLRGLCVRRVANLPTVQLHDGDFGRALDAAGHGAAAELRLMAALAAAGFAVLGVIASAAAAEAMLAAGIDRLALHPGLRPDPAAGLAAALRPRCAELWLYRAPGAPAPPDPGLFDGEVLPP